MARFLFTAWPFAGHFYPQVAIARALREAGHTCQFYTGPSACRTLADEGFECHPFVEVDESDARRTMLSKASGAAPTRDLFSLRRRLRHWLVDTIPAQVADLRKVIPQVLPDVVVADPTMWGPILILHEAMRVPVAVASFVPGCMIPGPDAPPFGLGLPPPRTGSTRVLARLASVGNDLFAADVRRSVNAVRRRFGLTPIDVPVTAYMGRMPLYLVPSVREFDYDRRDLPPSVHYVGPCLWNRPRAADAPGWLDAVPRDRPWVHVTEGTFHGGEAFLLDAAIRGLATAPVEVIATTGTDRDPAAVVPVSAPNAHVTRWISHTDLFPLTSVVVTTGGAGTVLAALAAGCPLVIVPTEFDKPDNARRVEAAGAGVVVTPRQSTPRGLRLAVGKVLGDPSYRRNARRLAAALARPGGATRAAELLANLASEDAEAPPFRESSFGEVMR